MNTILITLLIIFILLLLTSLFLIIQFPRADSVYNIRCNWIITDDDRYNQYSWDDMLRKYNRKTWYGLKIPKDEDFKNHKIQNIDESKSKVQRNST
jgi:hypothetical protein